MAINSGDDKYIKLSIALINKSLDCDNDDVSAVIVAITVNKFEKISYLCRNLEKQFNGKILFLFYLGIRCDPNKTVDYYQELGGNFLWIARVISKGNKHFKSKMINVEISLDNKLQTFQIPCRISAKDFIEYIHSYTKMPCNEQSIVIGDTILNDEDILEEHLEKITNGVSLLYKVSQVSKKPYINYVPFSSKTSDKVQKIKYDKENKWRDVCKGLNIEGTCNNPECDAFGESVVCKVGFGNFDVFKDNALCPSCRYPIIILDVGFYECDWMLRGVKKSGNHFQVVYKDWKQEPRVFFRCHPSKSNLPGRWVRFLLKTTNSVDSISCMICNSQIYTDNYTTSICNHIFHHSCYKAWCCISKACPTCSKSLKDIHTI